MAVVSWFSNDKKPAIIHKFMFYYKYSWPNGKGYTRVTKIKLKNYLSSYNYLKLGNFKLELLVIVKII